MVEKGRNNKSKLYFNPLTRLSDCSKLSKKMKNFLKKNGNFGYT